MLEEALDFLADVVDATISVVDYAIDKVKDWASNVWNWLNRFFVELWDQVEEWITKLNTWIQDKLKQFKNIVLSDHSGPIANPLNETLQDILNNPKNRMSRKQLEETLDKYRANAYTALGVDDQFNIEEVDAISASKLGQDDVAMRKLMEEHDHLLRVTL